MWKHGGGVYREAEVSLNKEEKARPWKIVAPSSVAGHSTLYYIKIHIRTQIIGRAGKSSAYVILCVVQMTKLERAGSQSPHPTQ